MVGEDGETYELKDAPSELKKEGLKVRVKGLVRKDIMTFAMIVLEVQSFEGALAELVNAAFDQKKPGENWSGVNQSGAYY